MEDNDEEFEIPSGQELIKKDKKDKQGCCIKI